MSDPVEGLIQQYTDDDGKIHVHIDGVTPSGEQGYEMVVAPPQEEPEPLAITDEQKALMESDVQSPKDLISNGYKAENDIYTPQDENDLGAALNNLIIRCLESEDTYLQDNARHVQELMSNALAKSLLPND